MGETIDTLIRELVEATKEHNRRSELQEAAFRRWKDLSRDAGESSEAMSEASRRLYAAILAKAEG